MRKKLLTIFAVIMCFSFTFALTFTNKASAEYLVSNCNFKALNDGNISATPLSENIFKTKAIMKNNTNDMLVYGDGSNFYGVDSGVFSWNIKIDKMEIGQFFSVSFLKNNTFIPNINTGAEGITYKFLLVSDNQLDVFILDAKDGGLLEEMKSTDSMWAYYKDGEFGEEKGEVQNYCGGKIGQLTSSSGTIIGSTVKVANVIDSASFGGTTFRGAIGSNSLGRTVYGSIFTNRGMDKTNSALTISAGGIGSSSDLEFTLDIPTDTKTNQYNSSVERVELISKINNLKINADNALKGTLPEDSFVSLIQEIEGINLNILRTVDKFIQQEKISEINGIITETNKVASTVNAITSDYKNSLNDLFSLDTLTSEKITTAQNAKKAFEDVKNYVKYLSGQDKTNANNLINSLNEKNLVRATVYFDIINYKNITDSFPANISETLPNQILLAEIAREKISTTDLNSLEVADKNSFNAILSACNIKVSQARVGKAFEVEKYKIEVYQGKIDSITNDYSINQLKEIALSRPNLILTGIVPGDKQILQTAIQKADSDFGVVVKNVLNNYLTAYKDKTDKIIEIDDITSSKIESAIAAKYDNDNLQNLIEIAKIINCDIETIKNSLFECDRLVEAAKIKLLLVKYKNQVSLITSSPTNIQFENAYLAKVNISNANIEILSANEKLDVLSYIEAVDNSFTSKAKSFIKPLIENFKQAVAVNDIESSDKIKIAKTAKGLIPDLKYIINDTERETLQAEYDKANEILMSQDLYYVSINETSNWTAESNDDGLKLTGSVDGTIACLEDPINIDGFDFVFDLTKIGRIWKGEDPVGSGKYPQNILVVNIMRESGKIKDQTQGFSIYFFPNVLNQLEFNIYGALRDDTMLANGKIEGVDFTSENYVPYTVRIRIQKQGAPLNCYKLWINNASTNIYYRDFINLEETKQPHIPEYEVGEEIGSKLFVKDKAFVSFIYFGDSLTEAERTSEITIKMIGNKTFADYVAPLLMVDMTLVSGPTKTVYKKGESFDKTGIVMTKILSDGSMMTINNSDIVVVGFTSTSVGTKNVILRYTDENGIQLTKSIKLEIIEGEETVNKKGCKGSISSGISMMFLLAGAVTLIMIRKKTEK